MFGKTKTVQEKLRKALLREPDVKSQTWDRVFIWTEFGEGVQNTTGFSFLGSDWQWCGPEESDTVTLLRALRLELAESDPRGQADALILLLRKGGDLEVTPLYGEEADEWRITPQTSLDVMEKAKALR